MGNEHLRLVWFLCAMISVAVTSEILEDRVNEIERIVHEMRVTNKQLVTKSVALQAETKKLKEENKELQTRIQTQKRESRSLSDSWRPTKVAFTARLSHHTNNLGPGKLILFTNVLTNIGDGYDPRTGGFTAPISGTYVMNMAVILNPGNKEHVTLNRNGADIQWMHIDSISPRHYASASRTVTLELAEGDVLCVRIAPVSWHGTGNIRADQLTMFSGWLLYPSD